MPQINERAVITVEAIQKGISATFGKVNTAITTLQKNVNGFNTVIGLTGAHFTGLDNKGTVFLNTGARMAMTFKKLFLGARNFRMELLSVMFGGQMLSRMMTGLLKPAMDAVGIFELWTAILEIIFLPVILKLLPYLLDFLDWVNSWDEDTKEMVGTLIIVIGLIGMLLSVFAALGLFIGGLLLASSFIPVIAVIMLVIAAIILLIVHWNDLKGAILDWVNVFKALFTDLWDHIKIIIGGIIDFISAVAHGDWSNAWRALTNIAKEFISLIKDFFLETIYLAFWPFIKMIDLVIAGFNKLSGKNIPLLSEVIKGMVGLNETTSQQGMSVAESVWDPTGAYTKNPYTGESTTNITINQENNIEAPSQEAIASALKDETYKALVESATAGVTTSKING